MDEFIDQQLLQQFSCLGTTDKEELIKQMQAVLGLQVTSSSAHFYLEMYNWNLQAAVGAYFDLDSPTRLPSMSLIKDNSDSLNLLPLTSVPKVWLLYNNGKQSWPPDCTLQFSGGDRMSEVTKIPVEPLSPNQTTTVTVCLTSPNEPGVYVSKWRMVTPNGFYFGDTIWVIMTVIEQSTSELAQQMSNLTTRGIPYMPDSSSVPNPFSPSRSIFQDHSMKDNENKMC